MSTDNRNRGGDASPDSNPASSGADSGDTMPPPSAPPSSKSPGPLSLRDAGRAAGPRVAAAPSSGHPSFPPPPGRPSLPPPSGPPLAPAAGGPRYAPAAPRRSLAPPPSGRPSLPPPPVGPSVPPPSGRTGADLEPAVEPAFHDEGHRGARQGEGPARLRRAPEDGADRDHRDGLPLPRRVEHAGGVLPLPAGGRRRRRDAGPREPLAARTSDRRRPRSGARSGGAPS